MTARGTQAAKPMFLAIEAYPTPSGNPLENVTYDGVRRFKASTNHANLSLPSAAAVGDWRWPGVKVRFVGALTSGQRIIFGNSGQFFTLDIHQVTDDSHFEIELLNDDGISLNIEATSTNSWEQDTDLTILEESNGSHYKLWVNGSLEIDFDYAHTIAAAFFIKMGGGIGLGIGAGQAFYHWEIACRDGDTEADRPGTSPTYSSHHPNADTGEDDATPVGDTNQFECWDDISGGGAPNEDTDYNLFDSAAERKQVSGLSAGVAGLSGDLASLSVSGYLRSRAATADKDGNAWARFKDDGGSAKEFALTNLTVEIYMTQGKHCGAPPAGAWTDYLGTADKFNETGGGASSKKLEFGQRTPSANDVNLRTTSESVEVCALDNDPPPVTADRRRASGQVI